MTILLVRCMQKGTREDTGHEDVTEGIEGFHQVEVEEQHKTMIMMAYKRIMSVTRTILIRFHGIGKNHLDILHLKEIVQKTECFVVLEGRRYDGRRHSDPRRRR